MNSWIRKFSNIKMIQSQNSCATLKRGGSALYTRNVRVIVSSIILLMKKAR